MAPCPPFEAPADGDAGKQPGRLALITGAASRIGCAVAHPYACEDANVAIAVVAAQIKNAGETAAAIGQLSRICVNISGNVTDAGFRDQAVLTTIHDLRGIDVNVDNPAAQQHSNQANALPVDQWELTFKADSHASFDLIREVSRTFARAAASPPTLRPAFREDGIFLADRP